MCRTTTSKCSRCSIYAAYFREDNKLTSSTYFVREIAEANETHLLPGTLTLAHYGNTSGDEAEIGRRFASIEYYNSLLAAPKPRAIDYFARGLDHLLVKNPQAAIADADHAIAINDNFVLAYFLKACAHYMQYQMIKAGASDDPEGGDPSIRSEQLEQTTSRELLTPHSSLLNKKSSSLLTIKKAEAALQATIADLDAVCDRSPKNVYAQFNRANAYMLAGDLTAALSCYNTVIDLKPDLGEAYYNRGLIYLRLGNKSRGITDLSKAGELGILPSYNVIKRMNR